MSSPSGHTHRLSSVKKGLEPDVSPRATASLPGPFRPKEEFFWGVATSGYQSEGGYNGPGEPLNNWAWAESGKAMWCPRAARRISGTCRSEDFGRCRDMGLNAFRLSIEWSRVQPSHRAGREGRTRRPGTPPPPFRRSGRFTATPSGSWPIAARTGWSRSSRSITSSIRRGSASTRG